LKASEILFVLYLIVIFGFGGVRCGVSVICWVVRLFWFSPKKKRLQGKRGEGTEKKSGETKKGMGGGKVTQNSAGKLLDQAGHDKRNEKALLTSPLRIEERRTRKTVSYWHLGGGGTS